MSVFVHAQGIKTIHACGRGGSKNGKILSTQLFNDPKEEYQVPSAGQQDASTRLVQALGKYVDLRGSLMDEMSECKMCTSSLTIATFSSENVSS